MKDSLLFNIFNFKFKTSIWQAIGWYIIYCAFFIVMSLILGISVASMIFEEDDNLSYISEYFVQIIVSLRFLYILLITAPQMLCKKIYKKYMPVLIFISALIVSINNFYVALVFAAALTMFSKKDDLLCEKEEENK